MRFEFLARSFATRGMAAHRRLFSSGNSAILSCHGAQQQHQLIQLDERVQAALRAGRPVVALESTIVAHGMPFPENLHLSQRVAVILRAKGVEPATIGMYIIY